MKPSESWNASLYEPFESLRRELDRFLPSGRVKRAAVPPVNVWTTEEGAVVMAEVPGLRPTDLELSVEGHRLRIRGWPETAKPTDVFIHRERGSHAFERDIELPFEVDCGTVKATLRDGILWIQVHRAGHDEARKIPISVG